MALEKEYANLHCSCWFEIFKQIYGFLDLTALLNILLNTLLPEKHL